MHRSLRALFLSLLLALAVVGWITPAGAAPFGSNHLVVYRVGDGSSTLTNAATPVFLDEFSQSGGAPVQSLAMPTAVNGSNRRLTASGTATSEGLLTSSTDGNYLMLSGYDAALGTAGVASTTSATVNRVVGRVDVNGNVDTTTALTDWASANNPRSVTSTNGTDIWVGGAAGGVRSTTLGSTTSTQLSTTVANIRQVNIFNSQLYNSDSSGSTIRLGAVGTGLPTTAGQTITNIPGFETSTGSPYAFQFFDLTNTVPGLDTLYVADDAAGVQKWSLVGGTWTLNGVIVPKNALGANDLSTRGLVGYTVNPPAGGSGVTLFSTSPTDLYKIVDLTGYNAAPTTATSSSISQAGTNTAFRGVAFAPLSQPGPDVPEVPWAVALPVSAFGILGLGFVIQRRRRTQPTTA
jgi:hypothetical protein